MNNPIACITGGYPGQALERVLAGVAQAGFRTVELAASASAKSRLRPEQMSAADYQQLQAMLAHYDLTPVSVGGHADLAQPAGVTQFLARIDLAAALGVTIINTGTGHTESPADAELFFALMARAVLPYAAERQVRIALETHGGLTGTAADCLRTLERLNAPLVGINYDPANVIYYRGVRPEVDLPQIAHQVIHVHLKDQQGGQGVDHFPLLGEGTIDFRLLVDTLRAAGYQGPYSVELEVKGVTDPAVEDDLRRRSAAFCEQLLGSPTA